MPSRLLRESILDSEPVNRLSPHAEVFYRRLMSIVDDYGRCDGRIAILRSRLYGLQLDKIRQEGVQRSLRECVAAGVVVAYEVNGRPYLYYPKLGEPRAKDSRFPPPPFTDENGCIRMKTDENIRSRLRTDVPYSDSDSDSDSITDSEEKNCPEPASPPPPGRPGEPDPAVMTFPTVGGKAAEWPLTASKLAQYRESFPGVDVEAECRKARQWCIDTPAKRKTPGGMARFLSGWLGRCQDAGGGGGVAAPKPAGGPPGGSVRERILDLQRRQRPAEGGAA